MNLKQVTIVVVLAILLMCAVLIRNDVKTIKNITSSNQFMKRSESNNATRSYTSSAVLSRDEQLLFQNYDYRKDPLRTAWCVIDKSNIQEHFRHFPHALQNLAPCWSYFCQIRQKLQLHHHSSNEDVIDDPPLSILSSEAGANIVNCGILFEDFPFRSWKEIHQWARDLMRAMNCSIVLVDTATSEPDSISCPSGTSNQPKVKNQEHYSRFYNSTTTCTNFQISSIRPNVRDYNNLTQVPSTKDFFCYKPHATGWFQEPWHSQVLQNLVLAWAARKQEKMRLAALASSKDKDVGTTTSTVADAGHSPPESTNTIRIAIVDRKRRFKERPNRGFANVQDLKSAVEAMIEQRTDRRNEPDIELDLTYLSDMRLTDQATWWNQQDIVIVGHGAAMSNVIFLKPGSSVIEVFPTGYSPLMFQHLMRTVNVVPYAIRNASVTRNLKRYHPRSVDLAPNITTVLSMIQGILSHDKD